MSLKNPNPTEYHGDRPLISRYPEFLRLIGRRGYRTAIQKKLTEAERAQAEALRNRIQGAQIHDLGLRFNDNQQLITQLQNMHRQNTGQSGLI